MKMYPQLTREYIRDGISYNNLVMLQSVIPPYRTDKKSPRPMKGGKAIKHIDEIIFG